jgi:hypothetical protein
LRSSWIGCHADSHEVAGWFGDDIAFRADQYRVDWAGLPFLGLLLGHAGRGRPLLARDGRACRSWSLRGGGCRS